MLEHKKKGRLRCHKRPKSETPKEGSDSGVGLGVATAYPLAKTIALSGSIERRDHGPIRRFMALALKAEHFCKGSNTDIGQLPGEVWSLRPEALAPTIMDQSQGNGLHRPRGATWLHRFSPGGIL